MSLLLIEKVNGGVLLPVRRWMFLMWTRLYGLELMKGPPGF